MVSLGGGGEFGIIELWLYRFGAEGFLNLFARYGIYMERLGSR